MKKIISSQKKYLKGFITQSMKSSTKKVAGRNVVSKLTLPTSFIKGIQNPIKIKKCKNTGMALLKKAMNM
jgi:hypothetical protein